MTAFDRLDRGMNRLCAGVALIGGLGLLAATLVTCVSIILKLLRRGVDRIYGAANTPEVLTWLRPILGEEELVRYGVGFALFAALPYVIIRRGHITVDLFEPAFGQLGNRILDLIGNLIFAVIAYLMMTRQWFLIFNKARGDDPLWGQLLLSGNWAEIADRLRDRPESQILGIKLWPTYLVAEVCTVIFFCVSVYCVVRSARLILMGRRHA